MATTVVTRPQLPSRRPGGSSQRPRGESARVVSDSASTDASPSRHQRMSRRSPSERTITWRGPRPGTMEGDRPAGSVRDLSERRAEVVDRRLVVDGVARPDSLASPAARSLSIVAQCSAKRGSARRSSAFSRPRQHRSSQLASANSGTTPLNLGAPSRRRVASSHETVFLEVRSHRPRELGFSLLYLRPGRHGCAW